MSTVPGTARREALLSGVVILDKPAGLSSNRAMARLKHLLGIGKMGYLGTLDPLATGVLPIFIGKATKLISLFDGLDKTYRCTMRLGQRTDTFDAEGRVVEERPLDGLTEAQVREALASFLGSYEQTAPAHSAIKVDGVPAYKLARQGEQVPERVRTVRLWDLIIHSVIFPLTDFQVSCSSGTYIRSLVDDVGRRLGVGAHLTVLRRLHCGGLFPVENSFTLERIEENLARDDFAMVRNPADFLTDHWTLTLTPDAERPLRDGREFPLGEAALEPAAGPREVKAGAKMKVVRPDGTLVAVGEVAARGSHALSFHPTKVLI